MAARDELVAAIAGRYAQGDRAERGRILDEFSAVTGSHHVTAAPPNQPVFAGPKEAHASVAAGRESSLTVGTQSTQWNGDGRRLRGQNPIVRTAGDRTTVGNPPGLL
jgi:hypothetical protein